MTILITRPVHVRLAVAYMAHAALYVQDGVGYKPCEPGNTFSRAITTFKNGYDGVEADHPYTDMWEDISKFHKHQGWDQLCDAEILELRQAAMGVGFTPKGGDKVSATAIHKAVKTWADNGWFRYEQRRSGRRRIGRRVGLLGLACVGVPMLENF